MFGFTRQEQKFILFLLVSFIVGIGVNFFKKSGYRRDKDDWSAERDSVFARFERVSRDVTLEESAQLNPRYRQDKTQYVFKADKKRIVGKVNLNTADVEMLQSLPGIGPAMAQRIIDYRKSFGPFRTTKDLIKVKGIGPKTFDKLKKAVTINSKQ